MAKVKTNYKKEYFKLRELTFNLEYKIQNQSEALAVAIDTLEHYKECFSTGEMYDPIAAKDALSIIRRLGVSK